MEEPTLNKAQLKAIQLEIEGKHELAELHYKDGREKQGERIVNEILEEERIKEVFKQQYDSILFFLEQYCDIREDYRSLVATWILGTYLHNQFETYPYLFVNAMRGSGKSRLLRLISALSKDGKLIGSPTEAVLFRMPKGNTICLDEFEGVNKKENAGVRELLNACYKKGMTIQRVKKQKSLTGEEMVIEDFEPYKPICMANIWGMEEVLSDRCVTLILEKSSRMDITKVIEDFSTSPEILAVKEKIKAIAEQIKPKIDILNTVKTWNVYIKDKYSVVSEYPKNNYTTPNLSLLEPIKAKNEFSVVSDVVMEKNIKQTKSEVINSTITTLPTYITLTTLNTLNTPLEEVKPYFDMFEKIDNTGINGRNLELFLPLLLVGKFISNDVFNTLLEVASGLNKEKKDNEMTESRDVALFEFVSQLGIERDFLSVKDLTNRFRVFVGDDEDTDEKWLNAKWFGRAIGRLNLVVDKRRTGRGIEVRLNVDKAKDKLTIFRSKRE